MNVRIDETGRDRAAGEANQMGLRAHKGLQIGKAAVSGNPSRRQRDRIALRMTEDLPLVQDQVSLFHRAP